METTDDCLFCGIISGKIKADIVYRDAGAVAFRDIDPKAPEHILIIPVEHISAVDKIDDSNRDIAGNLIRIAAKVAKELSIESYRLVINCGLEAGQSVFHLHIHLLAGREFGWPPG